MKNQIQQRNNSTAADASPRQTAQTRGRLNAQSYRQFTALGNNATSGTSTNNNIGSTIGQDMGGVPSNLSRGKGLSGSTPNLSESQMNEKYQRGFDTTPAERAAQLRKARGKMDIQIHQGLMDGLKYCYMNSSALKVRLSIHSRSLIF